MIVGSCSLPSASPDQPADPLDPFDISLLMREENCFMKKVQGSKRLTIREEDSQEKGDERDRSPHLVSVLALSVCTG